MATTTTNGKIIIFPKNVPINRKKNSQKKKCPSYPEEINDDWEDMKLSETGKFAQLDFYFQVLGGKIDGNEIFTQDSPSRKAFKEHYELVRSAPKRGKLRNNFQMIGLLKE
jgi:hypothetical protein